MTECQDCGQATLSDGVCTSCSDHRFWAYPTLKALENRLDKVINALEKKQKEHYDPFTNLALSYLLDIKNNEVPDYVINPTKQFSDSGMSS